MNDVVSLPTRGSSPPSVPGSRPTVSPGVFESVVLTLSGSSLESWEAFNNAACARLKAILIETDSPEVRLTPFFLFFSSPSAHRCQSELRTIDWSKTRCP